MGVRLQSCILMAAAALAGGSAAQAQVRGWGAVGSMRSPGLNTGFGVGGFASNSYGLGALRGSAGAGPLSGSVSNSLRRSAAASSARPGAAMPAMLGGSRVLYRPSSFAMAPADDSIGMATRLKEMANQDTYLPGMVDALGITTPGLSITDQPLKSLAGQEVGIFSDLLRKGENDFQQRRYEQALSWFTLANDISRRSPESLLSLVHVNVVLGRYNTASYHLRQAILYLPELPLANISLRDFFSDPVAFAETRDLLAQAADQTKEDAVLWFLLAYVQWFDSESAIAAEALRNAAQANREPAMAEALSTFWDGCVSSGKITGSLIEVAAESQPAVSPAAPVEEPS